MSISFKKITSSISAIAIAFMGVSPSLVSASSGFLPYAEALATAKIITKQSTETGYRLADNALRQEVAAIMIALNKTTYADNFTCQGKFNDVSSTKPNSWICKVIETALEKNLVAPNKTFRPMDNTTRAEALAMILKGQGIEIKTATTPAFSDTTGWQANVANTALANKIISANKTFRPNDLVTRGELFVMAANAAGLEVTSSDDISIDEDGDINWDDIIGDDTTSTGSTSTGSTSTGSTSDGTIVKAGDLNVGLNPASTANGTQVPKTGAVRFAKVDFSAGANDVSVTTVEIKSLGLSSVPTATRVWFEQNGKRLSGKASFSSERTAIISFAPSYVIKSGATETLDLYVDLSGSSAGNDFQFSGKIISSSAANVRGDFTTNTLRTADYTVASIAFDKDGTNTSSNQTDDLMEIGRFKITNSYTGSETRDIKIQSIMLRQLGNGALEDLSNVVVERNGTKVSTEVLFSGKDMTLVLEDTIKSGGTIGVYHIKGKINRVQNSNGDTYQFSLRNETDLNAIEILNGFRATVTRTNNDMYTYTINGADISFARDTSVELSKTYAKGSSDVVFMQGTVSSKSPITVEDPKLTFNGTGSDLFTTLYLQIGSSVMTWSATATGVAQFSGLATINDKATIKVYAKLKDTASSVDVKFDDLRLSSFTKVEYVSNQNTVQSAVGSIPGVQVTVGTTSLSVTRTDGLGTTKVAPGSHDVLTNEISMVVTQGNNVNISNPTYTFTYSGSFSNNVFATLYVDGVQVNTKTLSGSSASSGTVTFNGLNKVVSKTAVKLAVKVNLSDAYSAGAFSIQLTSIDATDALTSANVTPTIPASATLTIAQPNGVLSSSDNNPKATLLLAGTKDQKLLAFKVKAENDNIKLRDLSFTGISLDDFSNFRILTPDNKHLVSTSNTSTAVEFSNIGDTDNYSIKMDNTATFYLIADANSNQTSTGIYVNLNGASSKIKSSNGSLTALSGIIVSNTHIMAENVAVFAKASNSSKLLMNSALRFTVTASGKDQITLSGANITVDMYGISGTGTVNIYKDSVTSGNKVATYATGITVGSNTFDINLNQNSKFTVDAGNTSTYIIAVEGVTEGGVANVTPTWTVKLNNVKIGADASISANAYGNLGEFPITETK